MLPNTLSQWLSSNKVIIEIILVGLVIISVLTNYFIDDSPMMLMLSMLILATFYFISANLVPEAGGIMTIISTKVISISSAVCMMGLMFTILKWQGASEMLLIGTTSIVFAGIILLFNGIKNWNQKYVPLLIRVVVLGSISASTLLAIMKQSGRV